MIRKALVLCVAVAAILAVGSCAALLPAKKEAPKDNAVKEEDIGPGAGRVDGAAPDVPSDPGLANTPNSGHDAPTAPSYGDARGKTPRRIIWKDQKGKSGRSWENADPDQNR